MKSLKLVIFSSLLVWSFYDVKGQFGYYNDALLFSRTSFGGTSRIQAMGGSQVALGGDLSLAVSNPAGLGFYNKGVFSVTPSLNFHNTDASYLGDFASGSKTNFNVNHLGLLLNYSKGDIVPDKFKGGSFAITMSRVNDFHNETIYQGRNNSSSFLDAMIDQAGNVPPSRLPDLPFAAYDQFLIDEADYSTEVDFILNDVNGGTYITPNLDENSIIDGYSSLFGFEGGSFPFQREEILTDGAQYQINFSGGANYNDIIYFGAGLGVQNINYSRRRIYRESNFEFLDGTPDNLIDGFFIEDRLFLNGTGVNGVFGLTVRPVYFVTVGVSYTSPTALWMNEENDYSFETSWNRGTFYVAGSDTIALGDIQFRSDLFISQYRLTTPGRLNLGTAVFLGKSGFLTGDIEFVDYTQAKISSNDFGVTEDNDLVEELYTSVINYRFGGEFRFSNFRVRGGYNYMADPFEDPGTFDRSRVALSGGLGYRNEAFFVDLVLTNTRFNSFPTPYSTVVDDTPTEERALFAEVENSWWNSAITIGFNL